MYKIFINEKPFIIASSDLDSPLYAPAVRVQYDPSKTLQYIRECEGMGSKGLIILSENEDVAFRDFQKHFVVIKASGGIVLNRLKEEILLIKRLGKWDLPKGKIDGNETPADAAIREVMEECGIDGLKLKDPMPDTYHTYKMHNHRFLKVTHWYMMESVSDKKPVPQTEESITEARWFHWKELNPIKLDTYNSMRDLLIYVLTLI